MVEHRRRAELVQWVAAKVMPHEPAVRAYLRRRLVPQDEIDDLIQEGYCRLANIETPELIVSPGGFFLTTVRNLLTNQRTRAAVVRIDAMAELEDIAGPDTEPSPEARAGDRRELERVHALIATLPDRCRQVVELRKIEGLSQRDVAARLGITETIVENEGSRAVRLILEGLRAQGDGVARDYDARRRRGRGS